MNFGTSLTKDPVELQRGIDAYRRSLEQLDAERTRLDAELAGYDLPAWDHVVGKVLPAERQRLLLVYRGVDPSEERSLLLLGGQINEVESLIRRKDDILRCLNRVDMDISKYHRELDKMQTKLERVLG